MKRYRGDRQKRQPLFSEHEPDIPSQFWMTDRKGPGTICGYRGLRQEE
jgi:hypothetical protein